MANLAALATRFVFAGFAIFRRATCTGRRSRNALINLDIYAISFRSTAKRGLSEFPDGGKFAAT